MPCEFVIRSYCPSLVHAVSDPSEEAHTWRGHAPCWPFSVSPTQLSFQLHFASICLSTLAYGPALAAVISGRERLLNLICPLRDLSQPFDRRSVARMSISGTNSSQDMLVSALIQSPKNSGRGLHFCSEWAVTFFFFFSNFCADAVIFLFSFSISNLSLSLQFSLALPFCFHPSPLLSPPGRSIVSSW